MDCSCRWMRSSTQGQEFFVFFFVMTAIHFLSQSGKLQTGQMKISRCIDQASQQYTGSYQYTSKYQYRQTVCLFVCNHIAFGRLRPWHNPNPKHFHSFNQGRAQGLSPSLPCFQVVLPGLLPPIRLTNSWLVQFEKLLVQLECYKLQYRCKIILVYWIILLVWLQLHFRLLTLCASLERKWRCMWE
jgi:hypothetical protein